MAAPPAGQWSWRRVLPEPLAALGKGLAALAFPPTCPACGGAMAAEAVFCPACLALVERLSAAEINSVRPGHAYSQAVSLARHAGPVAGCVRAFKYRRDWAAGQALGLLLRRWTPEDLPGWAYIVCPVPLHRLRLLGRGFNQAAWLARRLGPPGALQPALLVRSRHTRPQVGLDHDQRQANVAGAFVVNPARSIRLKGRRVLIVDDVMTTGATLHECAAALLAHGAEEVRALTVSRAGGGPHHDG